MGIAHWDDVQKRRNERGEMAATWSNLGGAAGSYRCGVQRIELQPGEMPTPAHVHGEAEEIFYVLGGSGLTWLDEKAYEIRAGDCIVYKNFHEAHTIRAGDDGLDVLAFGAREYTPVGELPRGGSMWTVTGWAEVHTDSHPWDREPALEWPEPEPERVPTIVNVADVEPEVRGGRRRRHLGSAAGSRWTGLATSSASRASSRDHRTRTRRRRRSSSSSAATERSS
ncbi:MAG: cupin domain-containing protein [Actinobacteria bacterium]|nr:MAG: cupin domain-containing protein [Actinomycetota bacterium]